MSAQSEELTEFERRSRMMLEESVSRIDGRVRSRLNQARHAAVEAATARRRPLVLASVHFGSGLRALRRRAALMVAMVLWHGGGRPTVVESRFLRPRTGDLLADTDADWSRGGWCRMFRLLLRVGCGTDADGGERRRDGYLMSSRHSCWVLAVALLTAGAGIGWADDLATSRRLRVNDEDLLEFLGSVDSCTDSVQPDDGSWIDYLSQTDINRAAKPGNPTVIAAKPPGPAPKPNTPGAKQDE